MSAEELQLQKLTREVEKLQLDIDNLKRPVLAYWRNPASYLTALTVVVGVAAYAGQTYVSDAKAERAKAELTLAELKTKQFEAGIVQLEEQQKKLAVDTARLKQDAELQWTEYGKAVAALSTKQAELDAITRQLESAQKQLATQGHQNQTLTTAISDVKKLDLQVAKSAPVLGARIYIQVGTAQDAKEARLLGAQLKSSDVAVPDVEIVGDKVNGLKGTELRYFWDADRAEAEGFAKKIEAIGKYGPVALVLPPHLKGKTRPRHFELWVKGSGQ
jgi:hypothetical protein